MFISLEPRQVTTGNRVFTEIYNDVIMRVFLLKFYPMLYEVSGIWEPVLPPACLLLHLLDTHLPPAAFVGHACLRMLANTKHSGRPAHHTSPRISSVRIVDEGGVFKLLTAGADSLAQFLVPKKAGNFEA